MKSLILTYKDEARKGPADIYAGPDQTETNTKTWAVCKHSNNFGDGAAAAEFWVQGKPEMVWVRSTRPVLEVKIKAKKKGFI